MSSDWLFLLDSEWLIPPGSNTVKEKGFPCNVAGLLIVSSSYTNNSYIYVHQLYIARNNSQYWTRVYDHNVGQWSEWAQLALQ